MPDRRHASPPLPSLLCLRLDCYGGGLMDFDGKIICGVPNNIGGIDARWPFDDVNVYADGRLGELDLFEIFGEACAMWRAVCGINLQATRNRSQGHIIVEVANLGGPLGVLADCQLPIGFTPQNWHPLRLRMDGSERWVVADNPPAGTLDALRVAGHELAHGIGMPHIASGNLLAPTYSTAIRLPQNGDILQARGGYGLPRELIPPTAPTAPGIPGLPPGIPIPDFPNKPKLRRLIALFKQFWEIFNTLNPTDWAGLEAE